MERNTEKKLHTNCTKPIKNEAKKLRATTFAISKLEDI